MSQKFEVVFETAVYKTVFVDAEDAEEASNKAIENHFPPNEIPLPNGYELNSDWFVEGVMPVRYDD